MEDDHINFIITSYKTQRLNFMLKIISDLEDTSLSFKLQRTTGLKKVVDFCTWYPPTKLAGQWYK